MELKRGWTVLKRETKIREPYGGTWITCTVNITLDEDGYIRRVTVTSPDGIEHETKAVQ